MSFRLVSYSAPNGNVGDDYSHWLFSRALGDRLCPDGDILLFGVGSILSSGFEADMRDGSIRACAVLGSGARGPSSVPDLSRGNWHVYCVRGPLTALAAGLSCTMAIADPGVLAPRLAPLQNNDKGPVGIIPYFTASSAAWIKIGNKLGWRVISPHLPVDDFMIALAGCSRVWCESMHGAIFADAYGVPWRPISATSVSGERRTHAFKWTDWSAAMGLGFDPLTGLPLHHAIKGCKARVNERIKIEIMANRLAKADLQDRHVLSKRFLLADRQDKLLERIDTMCRELSDEPSCLKV